MAFLLDGVPLLIGCYRLIRCRPSHRTALCRLICLSSGGFKTRGAFGGSRYRIMSPDPGPAGAFWGSLFGTFLASFCFRMDAPEGLRAFDEFEKTRVCQRLLDGFRKCFQKVLTAGSCQRNWRNAMRLSELWPFILGVRPPSRVSHSFNSFCQLFLKNRLRMSRLMSQRLSLLAQGATWFNRMSMKPVLTSVLAMPAFRLG